jgi:hypothetical protein
VEGKESEKGGEERSFHRRGLSCTRAATGPGCVNGRESALLEEGKKRQQQIPVSHRRKRVLEKKRKKCCAAWCAVYSPQGNEWGGDASRRLSLWSSTVYVTPPAPLTHDGRSVGWFVGWFVKSTVLLYRTFSFDAPTSPPPFALNRLLGRLLGRSILFDLIKSLEEPAVSLSFYVHSTVICMQNCRSRVQLVCMHTEKVTCKAFGQWPNGEYTVYRTEVCTEWYRTTEYKNTLRT